MVSNNSSSLARPTAPAPAPSSPTARTDVPPPLRYPPLRILHVEDSLPDAELIEHVLHTEWPQAVIRRVDTHTAFVTAIEDGNNDVVLSDFSMPGFSGLTALQLTRERDTTIPFIFFSGTIGEENAVRALKKGATDYVLKSNPVRLVPAIYSALELTRLRKEEARQAESLRKQAELLAQARDAIVVADLSRRISYWNAGAERVFGWSTAEAVGKESREIFREADLAAFDAIRREMGANGWGGEVKIHNRKGDPITLETRVTIIRDAAGQPEAHLIISTDVTNERDMEQRYLQAQRMESIGILAGGIAHDLNNVLAPILMSANLIQLQTGEPRTAELSRMIDTSAQRGAGLVRQVLAFARGTQGERTEIDPRIVLKEVVALLGQTLPRSIELKVEVASDLGLVLADSTQLSQVLMNLGVNARDAMPSGGQLLFSAHRVELADDSAKTPPVKGGPYVRLCAKDTGTGIPTEIIQRIFDPFFTTKEAGKGTGLGLSTVMTIVRNHGGHLEVESEIGRGTEFRLFFPASAQTKAQESDPGRQPIVPKGRGEAILVVDDEVSIRELLTVMLESFGYRVFTASDGVKGLAFYREKRGEIAAVITDLVMPGMQGDELVRQLRTIDPELPIVAMSGMLSAWQRLDPSVGPVAFVQKPMSAYALLKSVSEVLLGSAAPA